MVNTPCLEYREALKNGDNYYFTGKPCSRGHIAKRRTENRSCVVCLINRTKSWRNKNPNKIREYDKRYRETHRDVKIRSESKRRALKLNSGGAFTKEDIDKLFKEQSGRCVNCLVDLTITGYHIDHKIPLSRGGSNWPDNLQLLCPTDNVRKNNLTDAEYYLKSVYAADAV